MSVLRAIPIHVHAALEVLAAPLLFVAPFAFAQGADEPGPIPWWQDTAADADGDRLHDALSLTGTDPLVVLAAFAGIPGDGERRALEAAGFPLVRSYQHFDVIAVQVLPADLPRVIPARLELRASSGPAPA